MKQYLLILFTLCCTASGAQQAAVPASIYDFKVAAYGGGTIDLAQYKGKKIIIINTPSQAFYNYHYAELESFYKQNKEKVVIIAFLDDDFGPAPGSSKAHSPAHPNYNASFPLAAKVFVKGDQMAPIYHWLTEKKYNNLQDSEVPWDFQKYLINEQGRLVAIFNPKVKISGPEIAAALGN